MLLGKTWKQKFIPNTSSFMTSLSSIDSAFPSSLEANSLMHCFRLDRGATPQISCIGKGLH